MGRHAASGKVFSPSKNNFHRAEFSDQSLVSISRRTNSGPGVTDDGCIAFIPPPSGNK